MNYQNLYFKDPVKLLHIIQACFLFAAITGFTIWATEHEERLNETNLRNQVSEKALTFKSQLEAEINANIFLVNGLAATIISYPDLPPAKIDLALQALYKLGRHVRNIGLAPGNRISYVYPMQGNESAIGLYYPEAAEQWPAVKAAIESKKTILTGPIKLRQGGVGLVSRTPIFLEDNSYWGILSLVLDYDSLFANAKIRNENSDLQIAIRNMELGASNPIFFGDPNIFNLEPVAIPIQLPGNYWELVAIPKDGWHSNATKIASLRAAGLMFALLAVVVFLSFQRNNVSTLTSLTRLKAILDTTHDGILVVDSHGIIREFNPAAEKLFGYQSSEVLNRSMNLLMKPEFHSRHNRHIANLSESLSAQMSKGRDITGLRKDGSEIHIEVTLGEARIANEVCYVGVIRDISERRAYEANLQKLAQTDSLTGALNRRAFQDIADRTLATSKRYNRPLSLLSLDVDYFKKINDTYGHDAGDKVLTEMVNTMNSNVRSVDTIARFGGEEFIILLPETPAEQALQVAEKIRLELSRLIVPMGDQTVQFTVSIGVASLTPVIHSVAQLITLADTALYAAKGSGRNCTMMHGRVFGDQKGLPNRNPNPHIQLVRSQGA